MAQEVELKLSLPVAEQRRFLRSPLLRHAAQRSTERLVNIYYDTPDLALHCNGIALRLRQSRRRWLQTVKCAGLSHAGLSSRPEWESPYAGHFDFGAIDDPLTRKRLERLKPRFGPIFETNFHRTTWKMRETGSEFVIVLDRGSIIANGKLIAISEVEIELAGGHVDQIFTFASRLAQHFSLTPGPWSKAERGYRLFLGTPDRPAHAVPVALGSAMTPVTAFRHIAHSCLNHLQQNHHGAIYSEDAEYIHQMRVALRRLRAAMRLFRVALPADFDEQLLPPLHRLMTVLGTARDLDVLATEIVAPVVAALPQEPRIAALASLVAERRCHARQQVIALLGAPEYGRLLLLAMARLNSLAAGETEVVETPLGAFAVTHLKRLRRKTLRIALAARQNDPASLHALRIAAKRLRYALEFFVPLLPARRVATLIDHLTQLQDKLGKLNDLANAGVLLMDCAAAEAGLREAVSLIGGWHGQRYASLLTEIPQTLVKLHKLRLPKGD
ncbi:Adenylate cyclase [Georgfuchsia toluolica]|uniref:Adenylate cyclase n=1 Tax=Georgfuchsia toluolica TaxID=424218 RepID=A0A916J660_9PROT|nr:CYTH and CHAD domain-containing protein [Georgfuchsia toluolica]CAG4885264.1 Adenylate cyclase [Georgfuchsia toluolica]